MNRWFTRFWDVLGHLSVAAWLITVGGAVLGGLLTDRSKDPPQSCGGESHESYQGEKRLSLVKPIDWGSRFSQTSLKQG